MKKLLLSTSLGFAFLTSAFAAGDTEPLIQQKWSFEGATGTYNRQAMQQGFQVYKEVCAACHGIKRIAFRNLAALGYSEEEIKAIASGYEVTDGPDDLGEMYTRAAIPADRFPSPYPNDKAARAANNGALPPDLSLMTKARVGGPDYLYSLLVGYQPEPPADMELPEGMYYNPYFPGGQIAMTPPLSAGIVTYGDGSEPSVHQMAHDVVTFLSWAAEPELEDRKETGYKALIYLFVFALVMYLTMRRIWSRVK